MMTGFESTWPPGAREALLERAPGERRNMPNTVPDVLVNTDWVAQHALDPGVRVVEVDVDTGAYDQGHVPGAAGWNWATDLCDTLVRDIVPAGKLEALLGKTGIDNKTTIVL